MVKVVDTEDDSHRWENAGSVSTDGAEFSLSYGGKSMNFCNYTYNYSYSNSNELIAEIAPHTGIVGFNYLF